MKYIRRRNESIASRILFNFLDELGYKDIYSFQKQNRLKADGIFGIKSYTRLYHLVLNVTDLNFDDAFKEYAYTKKQIIWHHSAGWDNARRMFEIWKNDKRGDVATAIGINDDGKVYRGFDEKYWAASIGCKANYFAKFGIPLKTERNRKSGKYFYSNNRNLDRGAVAVEICNWGYLTKKKVRCYSWAGTFVKKEKVIEIDKYRGKQYFERYTDAEIETLRKWTILMAIRFNIPIVYNEHNFWEVNKSALSGKAGLYTHNSYRYDKIDVAPQPHLIKMAKELKYYMK